MARGFRLDGAKALLANRVLLDIAIYRTNVTGEFLSRTVVIPGVKQAEPPSKMFGGASSKYEISTLENPSDRSDSAMVAKSWLAAALRLPWAISKRAVDVSGSTFNYL